MRKLIPMALTIVGALFCTAQNARAQSPVNVTATVKDSSAIPYSNATVSILLLPIGGATVGGNQILTTNNGLLDSNGKLNVSLYKNSDISPGGSTWQFTICETPGIAPPLGTGGVCFTSTQTVSAAVDFSTQFQAAAKALTTIPIGSGGGTVTNVSASAPITSTGGATPTIACTTCIAGLIADTQVAYGTGPNTVGNDGNLIWAASEEDPLRKKLTVQGSLGVLRPYNYTNALNSTWSIDFSGHQSNAATASFGDIQATVIANTNGAVSGQLDIHTRNAGALVTALSLAKDGTGTSPALTLTPVTVSALPVAAAGNKGQIRSVSDSTAVAAEGQTCVGGSTNAALAFSNGTVWKCF